MTDQKQLPYRFRESAFRFYEPAIAEIVKKFPCVVVINPKKWNMSPVTIACRLRDAVKSLKENQWSTYIDIKIFNAIADIITVAERHGQVFIGNKQTVKQNFPLVTCPSFLSEVGESVTITTHTQSDRDFLCKLASQKAFRLPIRIIGLTEEHITYMQNNYDVAIERQNDGSHLLI